MRTVSVLQDLFDHNDWANRRILDLCSSLSDAQLDEPREMGFGTLRNTLFHILEAEKLWLGRWVGDPWRPLEADAGSLSIADIAEQSADTATRRNELLATEEKSDFERVVEFQDSKNTVGRFPIGYLMHHVANHGVHHRAQALSWLKSFGITVAGGLDYLFWKLAYPSCEQPAESLEPLRQYGLQASESEGNAPRFEPNRIRDYFAYDDWAMTRVFEEAAKLDETQLDQDFDMGQGSLRKNLQHMIDAQRWWLGNWQSDNAPFPRGEAPRRLSEIRELHATVAAERNAFVESLDSDAGMRIVSVTAGGPVSRFRVTESLLQLCGHGTHHRAQCVNMLRQLGVTFHWIDLIVWVRENANS